MDCLVTLRCSVKVKVKNPLKNTLLLGGVLGKIKNKLLVTRKHDTISIVAVPHIRLVRYGNLTIPYL